MMRKFFLMAVFALSALSMSAQEDSKFMFRAGIGLSSWVGGDIEGSKCAVAYKIGAAYDWSLSESFSLLPGLELVNKGTKADELDGTIHTVYAQVPLLAAYKFNAGNDSRWVVKAGPYIAYGLFGSDVEDDYLGEVNVFDVCERFEVGVMAGLSYEFGRSSIGIEYSRGLTKLVKGTQSYNQAFGITFGFRF